MSEFTGSWEEVVSMQRSRRASSYERYIRAIGAAVRAGGSSVKAANASFARLKDVQPGTVHNNATLANVSVQYANESYIGEELLPIVTVGKKSDIYYIYDRRGRLAYPDDALGPRGEANEVSESRSTDTYACVTRGLQNYVDAETLENQDAPLNEMIDLTENLAEARAFKHEQRSATVLTTSGNYLAANTSAIAAGSRWDTASGGNPIKNIQDALSVIKIGRGPSDLVMWSSWDTFNVLSRHPQILDLFKYSGTAVGLATPNMIAGFFGISKYLVGKATQDTANAGQTLNETRMWGTDYLGITRVARRPGIRTASFGYTFRHGSIESQQWFDQRLGKRGGYFAKIAYSEDFKVIANNCAYLYRTVIG